MHRRILSVGVFAVAVSMPVFLAEQRVERSPALLLAWGVCLSVYVVFDLLAGSGEDGLWTGYRHLPVMVAWCLGGLLAAWSVLFLGTATAVGIRLQKQIRLPIPWVLPQKMPGLAGTHIVQSGISAAAAGFIYSVVFSGSLPVIQRDLNLLVVGLALLVSFGVLQLVRQHLAYRPLRVLPDKNIAAEVALLLAVVPLALVYDRAGVIVFTIMMGIVVSQAIRYYQVNHIEDSLVRRVQELSLLNGIHQNISSNLVVEDVLQSLYDWFNSLADVPVFYVALYDSDRHVVDFPLAIRDGVRNNLPGRRLTESDFIGFVIRERRIVQIIRHRDKPYAELFDNLPDTEPYQLCLGLPLAVGNKLLGVMVLIVSQQRNLLDRVDISTLETIANQASLSIRNAMLYNQTVRLAENLRDINRSVQDVMFNLDSQEGMQAACNTAMQISQAQKVAIFLLDQEDKTKTRLVHAVGLSEPHIAAYSGPIHMPVIHGATPRVVDDVATLDERDALRELAMIGQFSAMAEVPLKSGNAPVGLLTIFHDQPHHYHAAELELLETLAYQITAAIDYTELLGALELYASEQAQLVHLSRISTSSLELEKIADNVSQILQQMMSVDHVGIGLLLSGRNYLLLYEREGSESPVLAVEDIPEFAMLREESQFGPRVYYQEDRGLSDELLRFMQGRGEMMLALVPMIANNNLLGVILLGRAESSQFSDGEWRLMEMATNLLSTQLHNAQLYRFTQDALNRRLQQLALIENLAQQITRALDLDVIISSVLEAAIRATQADTATLGLFADSGDFRVITAQLVGGAWVKSEITHTPYTGLMGRVLQTGQKLVVADNREVPDYYMPDWYKQSYLSSVVVPLKSDDTVIGMLNVESVERDFFNDERTEFVENLAGHCMISIQNARLLQERQAQIDTLTELRELSLRLSSNTDKQSVVNAILEVALDVLQGENAVLFYYHLEEEEDELVLLSSIGRQDGLYVNTRTILPDAVAYRAAYTGEIQVIPDVQQDPDFQNFELLDRVQYTGLIAAPIKRGNQVSEVLCVTLPRHRPYLESERNKIELLTIQAAGHMANATLYEQIRTSSNRMRAILDSTRDGIILLDRSGALVESNLSAENLLNIHLEKFVGENFADTLLAQLRVGEGTTNESIREALTDMARILRLEPQRITSRSFSIEDGGRTRYIEEVGSPVMDSHNHIIGRLLTLRDVTEEKLLAAYRDEISHMVVHDLRGPLGSIISSITLTLEIISELREESLQGMVVPMMEVSLDSAMNLLQMVDSLLDIAKLETRRMPLKRTATPVVLLVEGALRTLQTSAQQAEVSLEQSIPEGLPDVDVDADKIRRVIINLLDNAVRFTPSGGKVLVSAGLAGRKVVIRVADSGPGIPPDEVDRVFEKFRQVKNSVPLHGRKGSGLGLTFCKLAVEAHDEVIWIEQSGHLPGACFAFTLPIVSPETAEESSAEVVSSTSARMSP